MQPAVVRNSQAIAPVLNTFERIAGTKALTVPEILGAILGYANPPTLASAARVSRAWWTIALDKLWSAHDVKLVDLLRLLPLDFEDFAISSPPKWFWSLQRNPTEDEWTRFGLYASRVRSLILPAYGPDGFDPRITEWKLDKDVLFPRLRKIEAHLLGHYATSSSQLRSFITPGLRELFLDTDNLGERLGGLAVQSLLDDLAATEGLHLQKFKFNQWGGAATGTALAVTISNLVTANEGSIEALELSSSHLDVLLVTGHSLPNLRALSFGARLLGGGGDRQPIEVLVEGCPNVAYLRIQLERVHPPTNILDLPGLRMILTWDLRSFEVGRMGGVDITKANIEEMAKAWPKLKKLNLNRKAWGIRIFHRLSRLADMVSAFPQLEELVALFYYRTQEESLLSSPLSSEQRPPSRLEKLRLDCYDFPESQSKRDSIAQFLARVLPPGLRIDRGPRDKLANNPVAVAEEERAAETGRDPDPKWDALFRKIEELHGGVRIWVGSIPENSNGVWF